jgi:Uma2 family endonuclease
MNTAQTISKNDNGKTRRRKPLLPHKLIDRLGLPAEVRIPATFEDWIELSVDCEYKVEYINGHLVSIFETDAKTKKPMGEATLTHEQLVMNIGTLLNILLNEKPDFIVIGSNMPTFIEEGRATTNPDISVVQGTPNVIRYKHRRKTQNALTNPYIIVEVLPQGTRSYDLVEKKNDYFKIPTLQQVIFVEQYWAQVMSYTRKNNHQWLYEEYKELTDTLSVFGKDLLLSDVYKKVVLPPIE